MATERDVQGAIHRMEEGRWVGRMRFTLLTVALIGLTIVFISRFQGLSAAEGMEQAQIARELARGNGFSTKVIRPQAVRQFMLHKGAFPDGTIPDTYNAPLNPWVNAFFLKFVRKKWTMSPAQTVYSPDALIAAVSVGFFMLALWVSYATGKRLFGPRLAIMGTGLLIVCNAYWDSAQSGLPQMLMLFVFSACAYALERGMEAEEPWAHTGWLAAAGALFGALALANGLTAWLFGGAVLYSVVFGRRRVWDTLALVAAFGVIYGPWMVRNYHVCRNPFGVACLDILGGSPVGERVLMRGLVVPKGTLSPGVIQARLENAAVFQMQHLYLLLGLSATAPLFFISLLHRFKRPEAAAFRWQLLCICLCGAFGMGLYGLGTEEPQANNLYILLAPLFTYYGLAFVFTLWNRLRLHGQLFRLGFISLIYLVSAAPLLNTLMQRNRSLFHWPPYAPPSICLFNQWIGEKEIIVSDMPWAVAWYADRKCVWLPTSVDDFMYLNDSRVLGAPLAGIYLTPVSGDVAYDSDMLNGEYQGWTPFILGSVSTLPANFPLHSAVRLPLNKQCMFYGDRARWSGRNERPLNMAAESEEFTFERAMARLENLVDRMEGEKLPLEELIVHYEEGVKLVKICSQKLDVAQQRIEIITRGAQGKPKTAPFEASAKELPPGVKAPPGTAASASSSAKASGQRAEASAKDASLF